MWQVLSLNDEIHQDINRKFIIAQDLNNQIINGQEIERPDTRLAPFDLLQNILEVKRHLEKVNPSSTFPLIFHFWIL